MAQNTGTLITAAIRPNDDGDLIASAFASEIKGGHHSCGTLADRNGIMSARREWGMLATITQDSAHNGTYQLTYGNEDQNPDNNDNWKPFIHPSPITEYPVLNNGQQIINPDHKPVSDLYLNGILLQKDNDYHLDEDGTVHLAFPVLVTGYHTDVIRLSFY